MKRVEILRLFVLTEHFEFTLLCLPGGGTLDILPPRNRVCNL